MEGLNVSTGLGSKLMRLLNPKPTDAKWARKSGMDIALMDLAFKLSDCPLLAWIGGGLNLWCSIEGKSGSTS